MRQGRSALTAQQRRFWDDNGYLVLPSFYSRRKVDAVNRSVDRLWATRGPDTPLVLDVEIGTPQERRVYLRDAPTSTRERPYKLNDVYLEDEKAREVALSKRLALVLSELVGGDVMICNGLYFERGSQQEYHFDTYYMPHPTPGGLIVSSVCLEDHHPDAGPLTYYPGSHKAPAYKFSSGQRNAIHEEMDEARAHATSEIAERDLASATFPGRAGDVFIWHEQLYHGGSSIVDATRTRRSLVTHYWRVADFPIGDPWKCVPMGEHRSYLSKPHQQVDPT